MKAFKYSLQALRTLRQRQEHVALQNYAQANQRRQTIEARLHTIEQELGATWALLHERMLAGAAILHITQIQAYCAGVSKRAQACEAELRIAERGVQTAWQQMVTARQELEIVEQHHKKQRQGFARELDRQEQKRLDEIPARRNAEEHLNSDQSSPLWN